MAFRTWGRVLLAALGVGLLAGAGQLGFAYGLGVVRFARDFAETPGQWTAHLAWVAWFAMLAAVAGGVAGDWLARRGGERPGPGSRVACAVAGGVGALAVAPLVMLPARNAQVEGVDAVVVGGLSAALGALAGVFAAVAVLSQRVFAVNLATVTLGVWLVALLSVAPSLGPEDPLPEVRLGALDATWLGSGLAQRLAVILMPALALAVGAGIGALARWRGLPVVPVAASGVVGPALLALAYLTAGPGPDGDRYQAAPYWGALIAVAAGGLGSVLASVARQMTAGTPATGAAGADVDGDHTAEVFPGYDPKASGADDRPGDLGSGRVGGRWQGAADDPFGGTSSTTAGGDDATRAFPRQKDGAAFSDSGSAIGGEDDAFRGAGSAGGRDDDFTRGARRGGDAFGGAGSGAADLPRDARPGGEPDPLTAPIDLLGMGRGDGFEPQPSRRDERDPLASVGRAESGGPGAGGSAVGDVRSGGPRPVGEPLFSSPSPVAPPRQPEVVSPPPRPEPTPIRSLDRTPAPGPGDWRTDQTSTFPAAPPTGGPTGMGTPSGPGPGSGPGAPSGVGARSETGAPPGTGSPFDTAGAFGNGVEEPAGGRFGGDERRGRADVRQHGEDAARPGWGAGPEVRAGEREPRSSASGAGGAATSRQPVDATGEMPDWRLAPPAWTPPPPMSAATAAPELAGPSAPGGGRDGEKAAEPPKSAAKRRGLFRRKAKDEPATPTAPGWVEVPTRGGGDATAADRGWDADPRHDHGDAPTGATEWAARGTDLGSDAGSRAVAEEGAGRGSDSRSGADRDVSGVRRSPSDGGSGAERGVRSESGFATGGAAGASSGAGFERADREFPSGSDAATREFSAGRDQAVRDLASGRADLSAGLPGPTADGVFAPNAGGPSGMAGDEPADAAAPDTPADPPPKERRFGRRNRSANETSEMRRGDQPTEKPEASGGRGRGKAEKPIRGGDEEYVDWVAGLSAPDPTPERRRDDAPRRSLRTSTSRNDD